MSRHREDPNEVRPGFGPLFERPVEHMYGSDDPATSRKAAAAVKATGVLGRDQRLLLDYIIRYPGETLAEHGFRAASEHGGDPYRWRLKLGRRTGDLMAARLVHHRGVRDGMARWWAGPDPYEDWP